MSIFPNYYPVGYQSMNQPPQYQPQNIQPSQYQIPQSAPQQNSNGIVWIQGGESGAKSYLVAPGQSVLLMDSETCSFYIKSVDPSGMPLPLRIFDYTERNNGQSVPSTSSNVQNIDLANYITREEFEEKIASLTSQQKSNVRNKEEQ